MLRTIFCVCILALFSQGCRRLNPPSIELSFDQASPSQWTNLGQYAPGELPFRIGDTEGAVVQVSAGLKGRAFDGREFISRQPANVPIWGSDLAGVPDTKLEGLFEGARSFTVTAWIKTESLQPQGRLLKTPAFQINYRGDAVEVGFAKPKKWYASEVSTDLFDSVGQWRFVAITWQSTGERGIVHYYTGTETDSLVSAGSMETEYSILSGNETGGWLSVGNSEADGNRPFVGLIDELKIWGSAAAAEVSKETLEAIRCQDIKERG